MTNPVLTQALIFKLMKVYGFPLDRPWSKLTTDQQEGVNEAMVDIGYYSKNGTEGYYRLMRNFIDGVDIRKEPAEVIYKLMDGKKCLYKDRKMPHVLRIQEFYGRGKIKEERVS